MEYTIKKMSQLSGVSARTLRYYDEIGLLYPERTNSAGYRIYGQKEINRLQQILFYRELGMKLEEIKAVLDNPDFQIEQALQRHQQHLLAKRAEIDRLLATVQQSIQHYKGEIIMSDQEKFMAFKQQKISENDAQYGEEMIEKYGAEKIAQSNQKYLQLTAAEMQEMEETEQRLFEKLADYIAQPEIGGTLAQEIFMLHKKWLDYTWVSYSADAHKGLATMYLADERFIAYYDEKVPGATQVLHDAIQYFA